MSLPTKDDLLEFNYSYMGEPYIQVSANDNVYLTTLDYSYKGEPFWGLPIPYYSLGINNSYQGQVGDRVNRYYYITRTVKGISYIYKKKV